MEASTATKSGNGIGAKGMADVAIVSELKDLGWNAKKRTEGDGYVAHEINGDRIIGPARTLKALQTQVNLASGPVAAKSNGNGNGNGKAEAAPEVFESPEPRLPTMEEPEIDELNRQADKVRQALEARKRANDEYKDQEEIMREKMRTFGRKRYHRNGKVYSIHDSEKLVIKDDTQKTPKPSKKGITVIKGNKDSE